MWIVVNKWVTLKQKHRVEALDRCRKSLEKKRTFSVFTWVATESTTKVAQELRGRWAEWSYSDRLEKADILLWLSISYHAWPVYLSPRSQQGRI